MKCLISIYFVSTNHHSSHTLKMAENSLLGEYIN